MEGVEEIEKEMGVERSIGSTYGPKMVGSNLIREIEERAIKNGTITYL